MAVKTIGVASVRSMSEVHQLPAFSLFIRDNHLSEFVKIQLFLGRELNLPLLKYFEKLGEEELLALSEKGAYELLTALAEKKTDDYIEESIRRWTTDQLPLIQKENVAAEDLTLVSFIRKQAMLKFIPEFVQSPDKMIELIAEIDSFILRSESRTLDTYLNIIHSDIRENLKFIEKIANTSPGLIYVYDELKKSPIFVSKKDEAFAGYSHEELQAIGTPLAASLVHPDDLDKVKAHIQTLPQTEDGAIRPLEYRMLSKSGEYRWVCVYETVFKRRDENALAQSIGIVLDIHEEKSTSQNLKRRDEQLRETQRIAGLGSFEWDFSGNNRSQYSEETLHILDLPESGTRNIDEFLSFVHPADRAPLREALDKALTGDGVFECEYRYEKDKLSKVIWSKGYVTFIDGRPDRMKGFVMDVTERHSLTQKLLRSERLYKQAEAQTHTGNWVYNMRTGELEWSDELFRIYGLPLRTQSIREEASKLNHPDDRALITEKLDEALRTKQPVDFFYRVCPKEGPEKIVRAIGQYMFDENGEPFKWFGTVQDVTKEKLLEKDLQDKKNFIQKIADAAPSLIAAYNINTGKYLFVSKALDKLLGYDPEIALENGIDFFIGIMHPDDLQPIMEANQDAIDRANRSPVPDDEQVIEFKYRLRHINGDYRWFHTFGTVFSRTPEGKVDEILNISIDITELQKMHAELQMKNNELAQSNANLEEFAYVASHDLKEPLRKISTFGDRLQSSNLDKLDSSGREYLLKIIDSSNRMQVMINDLLSISLISGEKTFEKAELNDVLKDVLRILEYKIEARNASIHADPLPPARIVVSQFRQLFQNILSNSLKFSRENHPPIINIRAKKLSGPELAGYKLDPASSYLRIDFSDNGIGFDNQFAEKIFAIFQRLHNRSEYEGTGIGLAICKKIVEHHKGIIFASGTPGVGATFTIIMPL